MILARVHWKIHSTRVTGHGSYIDSELAKAWVKEKSHDKTIVYWIEYEFTNDA